MAENTVRRRFLAGLAGASAAAAARARAQGSPLASGMCNVVDFGAPRNGRDFDTTAIQSAIDACASAGGGIVFFPPGDYYSGGVMLRRGVHLYLDAGAALRGSPNLDDYPRSIPRIRSYTDNYTERSLIYAEDCVNIGIHGDGTIDGNGAAFQGPYKVRPYLIRFVSCRDVGVSGVTLRDSPMWVQHYLACDDVTIHGITVHSRVNHNNDGLDIDGCARVTISDCNISSGDDAIVLKSTLDRLTSDVAISNCTLSSHCNAFKLGTESNGGFRNIALSNCAIYDTGLSGVAIEMVDGGALDGITVSNVTMRDVENPIFVRLGDRARPFVEGGEKPGVGALRNVRISGVSATGASAIGCPISGIPGHPIEALALTDIRIALKGGVKDPPAAAPENEDQYPEYKMFGTLPAHGFFCRHVRNLRLRNIETETEQPDARPALVFDDVADLQLESAVLSGDAIPVRLASVRTAFVRGCRMRGAPPAFLDVTEVEEITVIGNDLSRARKPVEGSMRGLYLEANRKSRPMR